jgi:hypothetical protein
MRPVTAVATTHPEVGVLVDAPAAEIPALASELSDSGIHVSFALDRPPTAAERPLIYGYGDQAIPRLTGGGLVRWLETGDQLHHLINPMGLHHHFVYASSGPSVGQWWLAHHAGGRLIAGAVRLRDGHAGVGVLRQGEVVEMTLTSTSNVPVLLNKLRSELNAAELQAVPVGRLMHDAGVSV